MKKEKTKLNEIMLVGLTARTNNKNEMIPEKSKIGELAGMYWGKQIANHIKSELLQLIGPARVNRQKVTVSN